MGELEDTRREIPVDNTVGISEYQLIVHMCLDYQSLTAAIHASTSGRMPVVEQKVTMVS